VRCEWEGSRERHRFAPPYYADSCGRYVPDAEITGQLENARRYAWQRRTSEDRCEARHDPTPRGARERVAPWPEADAELIYAVCVDGPRMTDLRASSPGRCADGEPSAEDVIDQLFAPKALLCCGPSPQECETRTREEWCGELAEQSLIVPSAMLSRFGFTANGKASQHAKSMVGPRQYLVVECDFSEKSRDGAKDTALAPIIRELAAQSISVSDMCASVLHYAAQFAPLALVVSSGGKSLHTWFPCADVPESTLREFFGQCCRVGADPRTWLSSQLVRIPNGTRYPDRPGEHPRRQEVIYFNPDVLKP
jgi:hypothetical protein